LKGREENPKQMNDSKNGKEATEEEVEQFDNTRADILTLSQIHAFRSILSKNSCIKIKKLASH
jgi:hypothetical protein